MLLSAHICRQRYPSESTISILQHLMHQQLTTNRIKILSPFQKKTAREAYVFAKTTKNYLSVAIRLVSPETLSPQSILLKFSIPKTLSRSSTHTLMYVQWGHGGFGYQIALFFFFSPPSIEWKLFIHQFQTCQKHFAWKIKTIHKFRKETYHLLLMTSVKTEILHFSPLITISPSTLPTHDKRKKIIKVLVPVQKMLSTSEIKPLISVTKAQIYTSSAA